MPSPAYVPTTPQHHGPICQTNDLAHTTTGEHDDHHRSKRKQTA